MSHRLIFQSDFITAFERIIEIGGVFTIRQSFPNNRVTWTRPSISENVRVNIVLEFSLNDVKFFRKKNGNLRILDGDVIINQEYSNVEFPSNFRSHGTLVEMFRNLLTDALRFQTYGKINPYIFLVRQLIRGLKANSNWQKNPPIFEMYRTNSKCIFLHQIPFMEKCIKIDVGPGWINLQKDVSEIYFEYTNLPNYSGHFSFAINKVEATADLQGTSGYRKFRELLWQAAQNTNSQIFTELNFLIKVYFEGIDIMENITRILPSSRITYFVGDILRANGELIVRPPIELDDVNIGDKTYFMPTNGDPVVFEIIDGGMEFIGQLEETGRIVGVSNDLLERYHL